MTLSILADLREKSPWTFRDVKKYAPDAPDYTLSRQHLPTGDYTLEGHESVCCLERKSRKDFINTLTQDTRRFLTEFSRMDKMRFSAVIVEDRLETFLRGETSPGQMVKRLENQRDFFSQYLLFRFLFPRVQWYFCRSPAEAEFRAFSLLALWDERLNGKKI